MKRKFSLADIIAAPEEELGLGEFCFLVVEILLEKFPDATLFRLTNLQKGNYAHVFVCVSGKPMDIMGYRDVEKGMLEREPSSSLVAERIDLESVREHFYMCYKNADDVEALSAAREKLRHYIHSNPRFAHPSRFREKE